jgi:nucleoside-diphosphate-sugar epimerase
MITDWRQLHADFFSRQRALVTGGAGFIGSHLAGALAMLGASVVVLDDLSAGSRENVQVAGEVEFMQGSILDTDVLRRCTNGCRFVFHQAAQVAVPRSLEYPRLYGEVNMLGTVNVLDAARHAGVERVMFAASSSAYGENPVPWVETMTPRPRSPYAATKVAGEACLRAYALSYPLDTVSLRYFNIFGPRQNANSAYAAVIAAFAKNLLAGRPPVIFGDGTTSRDFTYVDNAVHANLLAARAPRRLDGEVVNVACGGRNSLNELAALMARHWNRADLTPAYQPERKGDLKHSFANIARARLLLEYEPIVEFRNGLAATLAWYESVLKNQ